MSSRVLLLLGLLGCGSDPVMPMNGEGGTDAAGPEAGMEAGCPSGHEFDDTHCGGCGTVCSGGQHCTQSVCKSAAIEHVVLIVQENHTFDSYFGRYCTAPSGSNPTCTSGRNCCERAPDKEPRGASPIVLDDAANFGSDRDHKQACEVQQIDSGKMDNFVTGSSGADTCLGFGPSCASAKNWALADQNTVGAYWTLADNGALADRWFQPIAGGSASNDMYFAVAHWQFTDNDIFPKSIASECVDPNGTCINAPKSTFTGRKTIADLLIEAQKTFAVYADGYAEAKMASPSCPSAPNSCPYSSCIAHPVACHACIYDPSDIPFQYYGQFTDTAVMKDYAELANDLANNVLPTFSYVKAKAWRNEHPNVSTISDGIKFVTGTIDAIEKSMYAKNTLVLVTWDEGGGFFDHVAPPASIDTDDNGKPIPYGTRVPLIAVGPFAKKGTVSHVPMEHSSVVRFLEYVFLGPVGQLGHNDFKVKNIGSLLDANATGIPIPD